MPFISTLQKTGTQLFGTFQAQAQATRGVLDILHAVFDKIFYVLLFFAAAVSFVYLALSVYSFFQKKQKTETRTFDAARAPTVTIQIPTRNEVIALRCARKCLEFDYPQEKYEIMIGDDSNDPLVSAEIDRFAAEHPKVRVLRRKENIGFKPGNLNNMLKHTKSDIIVIFDSDFAPPKDFLRRIATPFIYDKAVAAVQARWEFTNAGQNITTIMAGTIVYVFHHITLHFLRRNGTGSLCGSAEAVRRSTLLKLGGWVSGSLTEDIEYSLRLHKAGSKIVYLPDLKCASELPTVPMDLYKQQMRWAHGVIGSYKTHTAGLIASKHITAKRKILSFTAGFGYLIPVMILMLTVFGVLSFVTNRPAPIDLPRFLKETSFNVAITMGMLVASLVALYHAKRLKLTWKMIIGSFSIGLVTTYYVNKGIFQAMLGRKMDWFLLKKSTDYRKG